MANLQRIVEKRGRTGKKVRGDTLQGDDTRVKSIKSDSDEQKKGSPVFQEKINRRDTAELAETAIAKNVARFFRKNRGVTTSVAAPGVIHPSGATAGQPHV